jgi:hypothetical protein
MATTPTVIARPDLRPVRFGLFSVADVRQVNDRGWGYGGITTDNLIGCGPGGTAIQPCEVAVERDVYTEPEFPSGAPWTAYSQVTCAGPPFFNEAKNAAVEALTLNEERQVEKAFMTELLADATDMTPGGAALPALQGIALLEGLWGQYGGAFEPTFHMDRAVALQGWGALDRHGNHLETELGSQVAAGAGYFDPAYIEADQTSWIVATGPVVVQQGVAVSQDPVFVDGGSGVTDNTWIAWASRTFAWLYLCSAIKVQVNSLTGTGSL